MELEAIRFNSIIIYHDEAGVRGKFIEMPPTHDYDLLFCESQLPHAKTFHFILWITLAFQTTPAMQKNQNKQGEPVSLQLVQLAIIY